MRNTKVFHWQNEFRALNWCNIIIKRLQCPLETVTCSVWDHFPPCLLSVILILLKNTCQVFCRMCFNLCLSDISSWLDWRYGFWRRIPQRGWCLPTASHEINMTSTGDDKLDHFVKGMLSDFSTLKSLFFSFLYSL